MARLNGLNGKNVQLFRSSFLEDINKRQSKLRFKGLSRLAMSVILMIICVYLGSIRMWVWFGVSGFLFASDFGTGLSAFWKEKGSNY